MSTAVSAQGLDPARSVGLDTLYALDGAKRRSLMLSPATQPQWRDAAHAALAADGVPVTVIQDSPGFVAQRIVATIVNIACDIAQQQIATPEDIDRAVTLGLGYPTGPLALGDALGTTRILEVLKNIERVTGDQLSSQPVAATPRATGHVAAGAGGGLMGSASARARKHGSMQRGLHRARAGKDVGIVAIDADGFRRLPTKIYGQPDF